MRTNEYWETIVMMVLVSLWVLFEYGKWKEYCKPYVTKPIRVKYTLVIYIIITQSVEHWRQFPWPYCTFTSVRSWLHSQNYLGLIQDLCILIACKIPIHLDCIYQGKSIIGLYLSPFDIVLQGRWKWQMFQHFSWIKKCCPILYVLRSTSTSCVI